MGFLISLCVFLFRIFEKKDENFDRIAIDNTFSCNYVALKKNCQSQTITPNAESITQIFTSKQTNKEEIHFLF